MQPNKSFKAFTGYKIHTWNIDKLNETDILLEDMENPHTFKSNQDLSETVYTFMPYLLQKVPV